MSDNDKARRRMVVEEVSPNSQPLEEKNELLGVVKEKVEELQDITGHISDDVKESAEVQEEIIEAAEKVEPAYQAQIPAPVPVNSDYPRRSSGVNPLVIIIPGVLLLGALLGGIVFYQSSVNNQKGVNTNQPDATPTPTDISATPTTTATASPSATTKIDLTKYPIAVFNGSGTPGEAGKVKSLLTTAGFKVSSTTNAATYDYTKTIIKAKAAVDTAFVAKLSETLSKTYVVDKTQTLDATSKNDVEVIVGTSKAN